jgi:hypothetical protein
MARPRAASASVSLVTARLPQDGRPSAHEVRIEDGRFAHATCSCGWRTAGRRDRRIVRTEARDHALLYAGHATITGSVDVSEPAAQPRSSSVS